MPISAVMVNDGVFQAITENSGKLGSFRHGYTSSGQARNRHSVFGLEFFVSVGALHVNTLLEGVWHFRFEAAEDQSVEA